MNEHGYNHDIVYTFEGFIEAVKEKSNEIDEIEPGEHEEIQSDDEYNIHHFIVEEAKNIAQTRRSGKLLDLGEKLKKL